jgi:transposase
VCPSSIKDAGFLKEQRLKCNAGKVCICLIQSLLTIVLSIEERVFLVEYVFREGNRYAELVQEQFAEKFPDTSVPHRNAFRRLVQKFRETGLLLDAERSERPSKLDDKKLMDISDSMLQSPSKSLLKLAQEKISGLQQRIKRSEYN